MILAPPARRPFVIPSLSDMVLAMAHLKRGTHLKKTASGHLSNGCAPVGTYYQARKCSDGSLADLWFTANSDGTIQTSVDMHTALPFRFIPDGSATRYTVLSQTGSTTHGTLAVVYSQVANCGTGTCSACSTNQISGYLVTLSGITLCSCFRWLSGINQSAAPFGSVSGTWFVPTASSCLWFKNDSSSSRGFTFYNSSTSCTGTTGSPTLGIWIQISVIQEFGFNNTTVAAGFGSTNGQYQFFYKNANLPISDNCVINQTFANSTTSECDDHLGNNWFGYGGSAVVSTVY